MTDAEFEIYVRRFMSGVEVLGNCYRPKDGEREAIETLGVIQEIRDIKRVVHVLNSQLVLNAVCFTDTATIIDAEQGAMPTLLTNVFRLADEALLWTGK